jgi:hypothetical protein
MNPKEVALEVALKMAYESKRDHFLTFNRDAYVVEVPADLPSKLHEVYRRGHERGYKNAMELNPLLIDPPLELDLDYATAWRVGYEHGTTLGVFHSQPLWARIGREMK